MSPQFDIATTIKRLKPDLSEGTIKSYCSTLPKLHEACFGTKQMSCFRWLFQEDVVRRGLGACRISSGTRSRYLSNILVALRCQGGDAVRGTAAYQRWEAERDALSKQEAEARITRTLTEDERERWVSESDVSRAIHAHDREMEAMLAAPTPPSDTGWGRGRVSPLETWVMLTLMEKYPSRLDLASVKLAQLGDDTSDSSTNYLVVGPVLRFALNSYKCAKSMGQRLITPCAEIQRLLKLYMRLTHKKPGDWLFLSNRNTERNPNGHAKGTPKPPKPLTRDAMRMRIRRFFDKFFPNHKPITITIIRKILLTARHGEPLARMMADAHIHGHSINVQRSHYIKDVSADGGDVAGQVPRSLGVLGIVPA
jgi:hypothetical protein